MKNKTRSACMLLRAFLCVLAFQSACCLAGQYTNFNAAIYIPVGVVRSFENAETLSNNW